MYVYARICKFVIMYILFFHRIDKLMHIYVLHVYVSVSAILFIFQYGIIINT